MGIPPEARIFCLGMHKTGTTSLLYALLRLGIRTCDGVANRIEREAFAGIEDKVGLVDDLYADYIAFEDVPWPLLWHELYQRYPEARFILTTRKPERWLRSVSEHFGCKPDPIHQWIYGSCDPIGNEESWLQKYNAHNSEVLAFFTAHPEARFLHLAIDSGTPARQVSDTLREFLDQPPGPCVWSQANSFAHRTSIRSRAYKIAKKAKRRLYGPQEIRLFGIQLSNDFRHLM